MLVRKGRLGLDRDVGTWVDRALAAPKVRFIELTPEIAVTAAGLDEIPGDPADRMIAASALIMKVPLVTKDEALRASRRVSTIW
jgi:PIN domain nuclease of toxin-antitoxin system